MKSPKPLLLAGLLLCGWMSPSLQAETLSEIFALASDNDAQLKSARYSWLADREVAAISRAALLPQISLGASYSESDYDSSSIDTEAEQYSATLSQSLFNMGNWASYQQGKQLANQADAQFRKNEQDLIVRVARAYTSALAALDAYETAKAEEAAIGRQLEQTKQRFEVGLIAITDVHESQASFDTAVVKRVKSQGDIGIAFEALEVITGQQIHGINPLTEAFPVNMPETSRDEWVNLALSNNPDLIASRYAVEAARENARAKSAAHLPTLSGQIQYNDQDTRLSPGFDTDQKGAVVTFSLNVPLYSGGGISASKRQAWYQLDAAREKLTSVERNAIQAARSQHLAVSTDVASVKAQQQAIISAQSALDATRAGYDVGTRNIVDVLNAEKLLYQTKLAWLNSRYQFIIDMLELKAVSGTLVPADIYGFEQWLDKETLLSRDRF